MLPPALDPCGPEIAGLSRTAGDAVVCVGYTEAGSAGERHASAVCVSGDGVDCVRAIENQVVWVSSNLSGPWGARRFVGRSKVVDPDGVVLAATGHDEGLALARIDPAAAIAETLLDIDHLGDRRPAAYGEPRPAFARAGSPAPRAGAPPTG